MSSLKFMNDPDVTPEDAVKVINALAAPGAGGQIAAGAAAVVWASGLTIETVEWSALPAAPQNEGLIRRISDLNDALFESDGVRWRPVNGVCVIAQLGTDWTMTGTTESFALKAPIPAGLLKNGDRLRLRFTAGKSGTVEAITFNLRLGAAGSTADTALQSYVLLNGTNISIGVLVDFKRLSATSIRKIGNGSQATSYSGSATVGIASPVAVSNMDTNNLLLSFGLVSSAASETVTVADAVVELLTGAA